MYQVDNAVIMAAGTSSRFAPLSKEMPKALIEVKGEIMIERQIKQLQQAGITDIYVIVGYMAESFNYLADKYNVRLIKNDSYLTRNNHSSIYAVRNIIRNTYICSADNYFERNPFEREVSESYYAAVWSEGHTNEWCMVTDEQGYITDVTIGGRHTWYMLGHAFWSESFSRRFLEILEAEYDRPQTMQMFWENLFINHLDELNMQIRKYPEGFIFEFDSLDELRQFDTSYIANTRSATLKKIARKLGVAEDQIVQITPFKDVTAVASGFYFICQNIHYAYNYDDKIVRSIPNE